MMCRPLRGRVHSGPLLGPPLLGAWLAAQVQTITSGGGSAEVRTFGARPPAVVGGAEVSPEPESEVSRTRGTAGGGRGGCSGPSAAPPSRCRGSAGFLFRCKFSREAPLSAPPPLAGTLVLRCSCWPSPAAVGVQPLERDTRLRARAARRFWDLRGLEAPARPGLARGSKGRWTCSEDLADLGPGRAVVAGLGGA